ncbi:hypothetical protein IC620_10105 [Hazenella sp. IB182357]|uniref:Uncharacterized protein n=1 Tax=Polycladospora coralii TaxID=2771432 RepID=A0A926NG47_9BACL|nr:hypothetical protein [Polycladospora coralii]MBD1372708.1 hypothetical protein [Polycladospora coralii]MBS7531095.1 hypothetical protein [Polycladospora coralii]
MKTTQSSVLELSLIPVTMLLAKMISEWSVSFWYAMPIICILIFLHLKMITWIPKHYWFSRPVIPRGLTGLAVAVIMFIVLYTISE